jgi:hypothetical protein
MIIFCSNLYGCSHTPKVLCFPKFVSWWLSSNIHCSAYCLNGQMSAGFLQYFIEAPLCGIFFSCVLHEWCLMETEQGHATPEASPDRNTIWHNKTLSLCNEM